MPPLNSLGTIGKIFSPRNSLKMSNAEAGTTAAVWVLYVLPASEKEHPDWILEASLTQMRIGTLPADTSRWRSSSRGSRFPAVLASQGGSFRSFLLRLQLRGVSHSAPAPVPPDLSHAVQRRALGISCFTVQLWRAQKTQVSLRLTWKPLQALLPLSHCWHGGEGRAL